MKRKNITSCLAVAGMALAALPASANTLITNGDFGSGTFSGWTTTGQVDIAATPYFGFNSPAWGNYFAAFNSGNMPADGTLYQAIATTAGKAYSLTFDYGVNYYDRGDGSLGQSIMASVLDSTTQNVLATTSVFSNSVALVTSTLNFVATSNSSIIKFTDDPSNNSYNVDGGIDYVSVTDAVTAAVPEPTTWAMMFAGLGVIGLAMRRRTKVIATVSFA